MRWMLRRAKRRRWVETWVRGEGLAWSMNRFAGGFVGGRTRGSYSGSTSFGPTLSRRVSLRLPNSGRSRTLPIGTYDQNESSS